ncbi:serine/threonine-protein phosphatase 6 regulatory ankyrin repeat subunit B-like [Saccostrea cucullata]|uniref:serine/threonine-protein phosphatase 6 regulatory ankyrin repeat subunit B-like n=1 Tax=Saccostrea cuccullata TaxID=36930 RepID=UPI002ED31728
MFKCIYHEDGVIGIICVVILFICNTSSVSSGYNFAFKVFPVTKCPMSKEEWNMASIRLKCNTTHGYHCVPDKYFTSLIEFCYPQGFRLPFEKGNCLELAADGILNHVPCANTFSSGCPDTFYFSNELYKFPKCLTINTGLRCFDADIECIYSRLTNNKTVNQEEKSTTGYNNDGNLKGNTDSDNSTLIVVTIFLIGMIILLLVLTAAFIYKRRNKQKRNQGEMSKNEGNEEERLLMENKTAIIKEEKTKRKEFEGNEEIRKIHKIISDGDENAFNSFISHQSNTMSLKKTDVRGFNSLHIAAKGSNLKIFKKIIECEVSIDSEVMNDKRNCMHIAAYYGNNPICDHLLKKYDYLFKKKDKYNMNPAHWAALAGQTSILELMMGHNCDLSVKTEKYEENIVLFACMGKSLPVCEFVYSKEKIAWVLEATNKEGWNSIQYAAKAGDLEVFRFLVEKGVDIRNKSKQTGKNCLHTACEKGHVDICRYILENSPDLIHDKDKGKQHVGHFAAKSGNTEILKLLIEKLEIDDLIKATDDNINILHIACKFARKEMCKMICENFPSLVQEMTEKGWQAALFITERAGAENDRINILEFLVSDYKLDVYHVSRSGKTILYNACVNMSPNLVEYLLENFPDLPDIEKSMNPFEAAKSKEIDDVVRKHYETKTS